MIKIVFLCGCLEPGKNGVGDYVISLADGLIQNKVPVAILALNDHYVKEITSQVINKGKSEINTLRINHSLDSKRRKKIAKEWIAKLDPEWLSLQFVPYSFNKKGIPVFLGNMLKNIGAGRKWHIMLHEIWLGEARSDPFKRKLIGLLQKYLTRNMILAIKPANIFTSNKFYQDSLNKVGIKAQIVPIFSNIPMHAKAFAHLLPEKILQERSDYLIATFFGNMVFSEEVTDQVFKLRQLVELEGKKLILTHIGKNEQAVEYLKYWNARFGIETYCLGEFSEEEISAYMQKIDLGLSTYPKILLEKSGSIAAMCSNGLPVLLLRKSFVKDNRKFDWIEELDEISGLSEFMLNARPLESHVGINSAIDQYLSSFHSKEEKLTL